MTRHLLPLRPQTKEKPQSTKWKGPPLWVSVILTAFLCLLSILIVAESSVTFNRMWNRGVYRVPAKEACNDGASYTEDKVISCYYNTPSAQDQQQLQPADIHPHLCTHINIAFATIVKKEIHLDASQYRAIQAIVKLKEVNPDLKVLISVGGAGGDKGFPNMVKDHASRKTFIRSLKYILRNYTLDGVDLDWEFPAVHGPVGLGKKERLHFSQLLREIKAEYKREKRDYLLTVAVPAPEAIVDVAYDIDQLNLYVDYVNIMTYDYHFFSKLTPFTGFNAPLYPQSSERILRTFNINYTVNMYLEKGLDEDKIVVGIPTYGHTFTLVNPNNHEVGSPATGFGSLGSLGFINYPDLCVFMKDSKNVSLRMDTQAKVPYLFENTEWVSFDNPESVMEKAKYIRDNTLRGAMIYSLNADDYRGVCAYNSGDAQQFPLLQSIKNALMNDEDY